MIKDEHKWRYCVAGNIVKTRIDENGELRYGTAVFSGGTKVYLRGRPHVFGTDKDEIVVIGLSRGRRYETKWVPADVIENVRLQRVWKPTILSFMRGWGFMDEGWWDDSEEARQDAERFVSEWHEYMD